MSRLTISRLISVFGLLGLALLGVGLFLPFITTIDYFLGQSTYVSSFWESFGLYSAIFVIGPIALVILTQFIPAPAGSRRVGRRVVFILSLILAIAGLLFFLLITRVLYCIFYCGAVGPWAFKGVRMLDPGFWVMLAGFLISIASSVVASVILRPRSAPRLAPASPNL